MKTTPKNSLFILLISLTSLPVFGEANSFRDLLTEEISTTKPQLDPTQAWHKDSPVAAKLIPTENKIPKEKIPTVVIVPGIFAEMIDTPAFSEAFKSSNKFKEEIATLTQNKEIPQTEVFDFESLKTISRPITEVFEFGELENNGERIANLILIKTELFSLDSLGRMNDLSQRFSQRLSLLFDVISVPENIIIVGYSRGAAIGLDMLSLGQSSPAEYKWLESVKSFVSLAGVIRGSALADETANLSTPSGQLLREVSLAARDLKPNREPAEKHLIENTQNFAKNAVIIGRLLKAISQYALHEIDPSNKLRAPSQPEFKKIFQIASELFKLHEPISEYSTNIDKLRILLRAVEQGVRELRSAVREDWWRNHQIPNVVNYYSIAASFIDRSEIGVNQFGFNFPSADDKSLYDSYKKIIRLTGDSLNDSQVSVDKATFSLDSLNKLNASIDNSYRMEDLGILLTHHWGIALSKVNDSPGLHGPYNAFPRKELLQVLVKYAR